MFYFQAKKIIWTKIWKKKKNCNRQAHKEKKAQYTENKNPRILKKKKNWSVQDWSVQAQQRANPRILNKYNNNTQSYFKLKQFIT